MKIVSMVEQDLPTITQLAEQLGYPNSLSDIRSRFNRLIGSESCGLFVAKDDEENIVGYIQVHQERETLLAPTRAEVAALVVDENARGKGIGSALLRHAESWAKNRSLGLIRLRSNIKRLDAHRFYKNNGYENPKSWHLFTKDI